MNYPLALAFLFYWGAIEGWLLEFLFRNLISHKGPRGKYFINPGFCKGPWLPIYGIGLSFMFVISWEVSKRISINGILGDLFIILLIAISMTIIEFIGGLFLLKVLNLRLWDYHDRPGNVMGIICPLFSLIWGVIGAVYYLFIHKTVIVELTWLSQNLSFSFVIGLFFGLFVVDLISSTKDATAIKKYGDINNVIVKYEELKALLLEKEKELNGKQKSFIVQVRRKAETIEETLNKAKDVLEDKTTALINKGKKK